MQCIFVNHRSCSGCCGDIAFIYLFIQLIFTKFCHIPDIVLGPGNTAVNKTDKFLALVGNTDNGINQQSNIYYTGRYDKSYKPK